MALPGGGGLPIGGFGGGSGGGGSGGGGSGFGPGLGLLGLGLGISSLRGSQDRLSRLQGLGILPPSPSQAFANPRLFQLLSLGGEPSFLSDAEAKKLGLHRAANKGTLGPEYVQVSGRGKGAKFARTPTLDDILAASKQAETKFLAAEQRTFDQLRGTPFGKALFAELDGPSAAFQTAFNRLGGAALGGAAQQGLNLQDQNVRSRVLGPVALQDAALQTQNRIGAATAGLGLTRGPLSTAGFAAPPGINFLTGSFLASQQQNQQGNIFNTGIQADALGAQAGFKAGLAQSGFNLFGNAFGGGNDTFQLT